MAGCTGACHSGPKQYKWSKTDITFFGRRKVYNRLKNLNSVGQTDLVNNILFRNAYILDTLWKSF